MAKEKLPTTEQYQEQERNDRAKVAALLRTEAGRHLLAWMERQYDCALVKRVEGAVDVSQTLINVGAREVVNDLRVVRDTKDREEA